jgi:hypothetical protein
VSNETELTAKRTEKLLIEIKNLAGEIVSILGKENSSQMDAAASFRMAQQIVSKITAECDLRTGEIMQDRKKDADKFAEILNNGIAEMPGNSVPKITKEPPVYNEEKLKKYAVSILITKDTPEKRDIQNYLAIVSGVPSESQAVYEALHHAKIHFGSDWVIRNHNVAEV